jgi:hypothetical protein
MASAAALPATILRIGGLIAPSLWTWLRILLPDERADELGNL